VLHQPVFQLARRIERGHLCNVALQHDLRRLEDLAVVIHHQHAGVTR
jgi:hypothetical protein